MRSLRLALSVLLWSVCVLSQEIQMKTFETGKDASLQCSNTTLDELRFELWSIETRDGDYCEVTWPFQVNDMGPRVTIRQEENSVILHISQFSSSDEGNYTCKTFSRKGLETFYFNVKAFARYNENNIFTHENVYPHFIILLIFAGTIAMTFFIFSIMRKKQEAQTRKYEERGSKPCDQRARMDLA